MNPLTKTEQEKIPVQSSNKAHNSGDETAPYRL